jgi:hypothetical protein
MFLIRIAYPSRAHGFIPVFGEVCASHLFSFLLCVFALFIFIPCLVYPMLPVFQDRILYLPRTAWCRGMIIYSLYTSNSGVGNMRVTLEQGQITHNKYTVHHKWYFITSSRCMPLLLKQETVDPFVDKSLDFNHMIHSM